VKYLLDTHLLLWAAQGSDRMSETARALIFDEGNELLFSAASLWEITIKSELGRNDFVVNPAVLLRGLVEQGYTELAISARHVIAVANLAPIHKDPFDRILLAQALSEGVTLLTSDGTVAGYPTVPVRLV
jgi:PIN domain nuclease of toxin-antitoxin system